MDRRKFAQILKAEMSRRGWLPADLANALGKSVETAYSYIREEDGRVWMTTVYQVADALGVPRSVFFEPSYTQPVGSPADGETDLS